ncbi:MAG: aldehyde dehydrogenase family protein [Inhella sp.]
MQRLHGMGEGIYREVLKDKNTPCRVYAPVGEHRSDLLGFPSGAPPAEKRRQLQLRAPAGRPARVVPELLGCPLEDLRPAPTQPLPLNLYKAVGESRVNSRGADLASPTQRAPFTAAVQACQVPAVPVATAEDVQAAMACLQAGFAGWAGTPVAQRAAVLRRAADAMEAELAPLCGLLVKEAHKTLADCIAEVREAVDFLRYYADEAELATPRWRRPWACSSASRPGTSCFSPSLPPGGGRPGGGQHRGRQAGRADPGGGGGEVRIPGTPLACRRTPCSC